MTIRIPKPTNRSQVYNTADDVTDAKGSFGYASYQVPGRIEAPDTSGVTYRGKMAKAGAIGEVGDVLGNLAHEMKNRENALRVAEESTDLDKRLLEYNKQLLEIEHDVTTQFNENNWSVDQWQEEMNARTTAAREEFKAGSQYKTNKINGMVDDALLRINGQQELNLIKKGNEYRAQRATVAINESIGALRTQIDQAEDVNRVLALVDQMSDQIARKAIADHSMTPDKIQAEIEAETHNAVVQHASKLAFDGKYEEALEVYENLPDHIKDRVNEQKFRGLMKEIRNAKKSEDAYREAEIRKAEQERIQQNENEIYDRRMGMREGGRADAQELFDLRQNGDISEGFYRQELNGLRVDTARSDLTRLNLEHVHEAIENGERGHFKVKEDRDAAEDWYQANKQHNGIDSINTVEDAQRLSHIVGPYGVIPQGFQDDVRRGLASGNPEKMQASAAAIEYLTRDHGMYEQIYGSEAKLFTEDERLLINLLNKGADPSTVTKMVDDMRNTPPEVRDHRSRTYDADYRESHSRTFKNDLKGEFSTGFFNNVPDLPPVFEARFLDSVEKYHRLQGDPSVAYKMAWEDFVSEYGVTDINGERMWTRRPIERLYPHIPPAEIRRQMLEDVSKHSVGLDPENVRGVYDPKASLNAERPGVRIETKERGFWEPMYRWDTESNQHIPVYFYPVAKDEDYSDKQKKMLTKRARRKNMNDQIEWMRKNKGSGGTVNMDLTLEEWLGNRK